MTGGHDPAPPFDNARLSAHALDALRERDIPVEALRRILASPEHWEPVRPGRVVCEGIIEQSGRRYLLRIFVDLDAPPGRIVTVYRTSKMAKYRREP